MKTSDSWIVERMHLFGGFRPVQFIPEPFDGEYPRMIQLKTDGVPRQNIPFIARGVYDFFLNHFYPNEDSFPLSPEELSVIHNLIYDRFLEKG